MFNIFFLPGIILDKRMYGSKNGKNSDWAFKLNIKVENSLNSLL